MHLLSNHKCRFHVIRTSGSLNLDSQVGCGLIPRSYLALIQIYYHEANVVFPEAPPTLETMPTDSCSTSQPLQEALHSFQGILSPEQRNSFLSSKVIPDAAAVITFTAEVDNENAKRRTRCVASRLCGFLESVQQFSAIVDTFITSNPGVAALVWGGVKLAILVSLP